VTKQKIETPSAPNPAGAYSQGVVAGGFLYTAGFGPQDAETGAVADTVGEQTAQTLHNVTAVLEQQSLGLNDVVKVTVHLQHLKRDFAEFNQTYGTFFNAPYPVRTTVGSDLYDILVEIDVVAKLR
jgi:2-iminobutanoate/2-iminopropanoate deaminase